MHKYAEIYGGKVRDIQKSALVYSEFVSVFSPTSYWIDITGQSIEVGYVQEYKEGVGITFVAPIIELPTVEETLEELKDRKITALKSTRDTLEVAPITTDKGVFDFDMKARDRLDIALKALTASGGTIAWTLTANTQVDVTSSDINNVFLAAATRSNELHEKYRALKGQVNVCMDAESVSKVTWGCY